MLFKTLTDWGKKTVKKTTHNAESLIKSVEIIQRLAMNYGNDPCFGSVTG